MEYDSANRLISYNNKKIKYDKDGNMLYGPVNGEMCNLTYDSRNRLISAGNVTYDYDAENTRISVTTTDKKITYVTDVAGEMSQVLESYEKTNGGKKIHTVYVYGNGLIYSYNDNEADSTTSDNKVQDLSSDKSSDKDTDGTTYYHYNNIGSTTKLTDNNGNVIQSYEYGAYGEVLSGDTKITPFLYNGQLGVMTDNNGLYYMRARYYNVNIKRFINQDVVHGSINVSQSLNRYSYVQGNPIKLTDPFGLSPLDRLNWKNLGHAILNGLGLIPVIGEAFDIANAIWYAHDGEYGMAVLSMMSALPMIGNIASGIMTAAKITTAAKIVSTVCKVVSNAATFTQAAIGGVNNAKAIVKNMINGKLFSEDTAKNLVSFGINAFTAATSGKNLLSSSKELKKVVGDSVGSKWGKKAKKEPLLECNLQFFADKNGCEPTGATYEGSIYRSVDSRYNPLEMSQYTINSNHRYTESGVPGLYFSSGEKIVKAELGNYDVFDFSNRTMYQYDVRLTNMLDVSNPSVRSQLNISLESIIGESYDVTHAIGRYAYSNGYNGIIAPSARADGGINIILFNAKGVK